MLSSVRENRKNVCIPRMAASCAHAFSKHTSAHCIAGKVLFSETHLTIDGGQHNAEEAPEALIELLPIELGFRLAEWPSSSIQGALTRAERRYSRLGPKLKSGVVQRERGYLEGLVDAGLSGVLPALGQLAKVSAGEVDARRDGGDNAQPR